MRITAIADEWRTLAGGKSGRIADWLEEAGTGRFRLSAAPIFVGRGIYGPKRKMAQGEFESHLADDRFRSASLPHRWQQPSRRRFAQIVIDHPLTSEASACLEDAATG